MRRIVPGLLALLILITSAGAAHAAIMAIKRSPGMAVDQGLDPTFQAAIAGGTVTYVTGAGAVADADIYPSPGLIWFYMNTGTNGQARSFQPILMKFDLSSLPQRVVVHKAQLRLYHYGGSTGLPAVSYVTSCDWAEGNKGGNGTASSTADYPGKVPAAPGVTAAHPSGLNTGMNQDASGGTTGPLQSWAGDTYFSAAKDCSSYSTPVGTAAAYTGTMDDGSTSASDGFYTVDVTSIVQAWTGGTANYGFYIPPPGNYIFALSETRWGANFQPVLFISYDAIPIPSPIADLAAEGSDWYKVYLRWTAPSGYPGPIVRYDLRYSSGPIVDDATFDAATVASAPTPAAPGSTQDASVTGLWAGTTYYFAVKYYDPYDQVSPLSNVVAMTTPPCDCIPPDPVSDLAAASIRPNYVKLQWTVPLDDGLPGRAVAYDLRYSSSPIANDADFAAATTILGLPAPQPAGSLEAFTIHGLTPVNTYHFAIKVRDAATGWSAMSNVLTVTTPECDCHVPTVIADLRVVGSQSHMAYLAWTAPSTYQGTSVAGYEIRYSTSPLNDSNWASATVVPNTPIPAAPWNMEHFVATGLPAEATCYIAIKSFNFDEPAYWSPLSNVVYRVPPPPHVPAVVRNPWLTSDRVADTHNISTMGSTYINAYTPDGVVTPANDQAKAINIYNNQKRRLYHWACEPPTVGGNDINDPTYNQNVFGWGLCGRQASQACTIAAGAGFPQRKITVPGHIAYEVQYNNAWHLYDTMITMYLFNKATPAAIASAAEIKADHNLMLNAAAESRACPGFLLCGDTPQWYADALNTWADSGSGAVTTRWTGEMDLRFGQTFTRTWESWLNQHPASTLNADTLPGNDPPYHHEANKDWKDTVNFPYWEPYGLSSAQNTVLGIGYSATYRRWANGTDTLAPDFSSAAGKDMLEAASHDIVTYYDDGITPALHPLIVGTTGEAILKVNIPFYITDANISGDFVRTNANDVCKVFVSSNGTVWTQVYDAPIGTTHLANLNLRSNVLGLWQTYYVKIQLKSSVAKGDAGVPYLAIQTVFEHNKGAMPYLDKGINRITFTFDNAAEFQATNTAVHIVYKWKEYDGTGWTIAKQAGAYASTSPYTFTIRTYGSKVPRTESITMEIAEPCCAFISPVVDLAWIGRTSTRVTLTWTAVSGGYDPFSTATAYDLRCSTTPIFDDASFAAATPVPNAPLPQPAGYPEAFTVTGLQPGMGYYFAIKVYGDDGNVSPLSNVAMVPPSNLPPAWVNDLMGQPSQTGGAVDLTWTATGDMAPAMPATGYDLRYSTSEIRYDDNDATWNAATPVIGLPAPLPPPEREAFTVTGLVPGQQYYFAIKVVDGSGDWSEVSNCAPTIASPAGGNPPLPVPGDINGDAAVDVVDLLYLVDTFGLYLGERGFDLRADFNRDASVDVVDLLTFVENFGT